MHWAGSLFLCICILIIFLLCMPLRLVVYTEYHQSLRGEVTVQYLWMRRIIPLESEKSQKQSAEEHIEEKRCKLHLKMKLQWVKRAYFVRWIMKINRKNMRWKYKKYLKILMIPEV